MSWESRKKSISPLLVRRAFGSTHLLEDGVVEIGAIHTYVELYARLFVDLVPNVVLVCAEQADRAGNLYTGPNTEETPVIVEAAAFHDAIVIVQANQIVPRENLEMSERMGVIFPS